MEKLNNLFSKLKKMFRSSDSKNFVEHIRCEDLFFPSKNMKGDRKRDSYADDPFVVAQTAAQNHFALRPNIYL